MPTEKWNTPVQSHLSIPASAIEHATTAPDIEVHPLTADRWSDLAALFAQDSVTRTCWCMWFRQSNADSQANGGAKNRDAFRRIVQAGPPPGVLAYVGGKAAGWCAIGPRESYSRLGRSRTLKAVDDKPV